jgi:hypothetical protein
VFVDGHSFHVGYPVVMYCKEQGIILQTLPPPNGPFRRYFREDHDEFMRRNPGKAITIYDVPIISKLVIEKAFPEHSPRKDFLPLEFSHLIVQRY